MWYHLSHQRIHRFGKPEMEVEVSPLTITRNNLLRKIFPPFPVSLSLMCLEVLGPKGRMLSPETTALVLINYKLNLLLTIRGASYT